MVNLQNDLIVRSIFGGLQDLIESADEKFDRDAILDRIRDALNEAIPGERFDIPGGDEESLEELEARHDAEREALEDRHDAERAKLAKQQGVPDLDKIEDDDEDDDDEAVEQAERAAEKAEKAAEKAAEQAEKRAEKAAERAERQAEKARERADRARERADRKRERKRG